MDNFEDLFEYLFEEIENDEPPFKKQKINHNINQDTNNINQGTNNINQDTNNINQLIKIININLKNILL